LFSGNTAGASGGALYFDSDYCAQARISINACTLSGNASSSSGAIGSDGACQIDDIKNSILYKNFPIGIAEGIGAITTVYSNIQGTSYVGTGVIDKDPLFKNTPIETTITSAAGTTSTVVLSFVVKPIFNKFIIEIGNDGVAREVTKIENDEVSFEPPLLSASVQNMRVDIWGRGVTNLENDFSLKSGSPCIDAANGDMSPPLDLDGFSRFDDPSTPNTGTGTPNYADMGCYEYRGL
jgi:hypothetical protein